MPHLSERHRTRPQRCRLRRSTAPRGAAGHAAPARPAGLAREALAGRKSARSVPLRTPQMRPPLNRNLVYKWLCSPIYFPPVENPDFAGPDGRQRYIVYGVCLSVVLFVFRAAFIPEKFLQKLSAAFLTASDLHARVGRANGVTVDCPHTSHCAGYRIGGAAHHTSHTRLQDRAGAHGTRFQCDVQCAGRQTPRPQRRTGGFQCIQLGMTEGCLQELAGVVPCGKNASVRIGHQYGADRNIAVLGGDLRFTECDLHVADILIDLHACIFLLHISRSVPNHPPTVRINRTIR